MDTTDVLSNYFMTVDMHRFDLMWLVYSRNKFFRVGPNISEKFVPGGTNFRGVQIKRDRRNELGAISIFPRLTKQVSAPNYSDSESVFPDTIPS